MSLIRANDESVNGPLGGPRYEAGENDVRRG